MSPASISPSLTHSAADFLPPPYEHPHVRRQLDELIREVTDVIAPVWPLRDYVAVNPYAGISQRSFAEARTFLKLFSDCEMLMPLDYFAQQFRQGSFGHHDIQAAIEELGSMRRGRSGVPTAEEVIGALVSRVEMASRAVGVGADSSSAVDREGILRTISDHLDRQSASNWSEIVRDEVSRHCAAHYDQGQAEWKSPWRHLSLYQAWRSAAVLDCNVEALGLSGFRQFVSRLPHSPDAAIAQLLERLQLPRQLWSVFLLCQAFSIPGWSAYAKYQSRWSGDGSVERDDLEGLLAIRLSYDVALSEAFALQVNWNFSSARDGASFPAAAEGAGGEVTLRWIALRAMEIAYRSQLLDTVSLASQSARDDDVGLAAHKRVQMVFCIDVRSERMRRHLEAQSCEIETLGFAGFFGMPIEFLELGRTRGDAHVPVLLRPQFQVHESVRGTEQQCASNCETSAIAARQRIRRWRAHWKAFQTSAVGCFSCVETTGLLYAWKLMARATGWGGRSVDARSDGLGAAERQRVGPTLRGLAGQGVTVSRQADLAETMLRNLGLTEDFARLVVFCGHASQTDNNPLAASLDCGACGGHSGEPNARLVAMLLNQPAVRGLLAERGIVIPRQTHFLAGLHDTTTDQVTLRDIDAVPATHRGDLEELQCHLARAGEQTRRERMPILGCPSLPDLLSRAGDWSEVRPEWGLVGNAAFIAAPRSLTAGANLDGRAFLHSYDHRRDPDGTVLETIMTAPMIVAHWINMQYYASTVDHDHFGSGNKTVHNVVGLFGILSGNGGDLKTGLPWQSLHNGERLQHRPMRLQVVIAAPRDSIDRVIARHETVANLLGNGWLHLVALDEGAAYRYAQDGSWQLLEPAGTLAAV